MDKELKAIAHRLPFRDGEIERLAKYNRMFLDICEDYAVAEAALKHWSTAPPGAMTDVCKSEYTILVEELATEIEQLLDAATTSKR